MINHNDADELKIEPKHMALFPTMETLQSCVDLGISQLPITDKNAVVGLLMIYHNTLIKQLEKP